VPRESYYEVLGVDPYASQREVKAAFRRLSLRVHPDHGGSAEQFVLIQQAYDTLSDPLRRAAYDRALRHRGVGDLGSSAVEDGGEEWWAEPMDPWPPSAWASAPPRRRSTRAFALLAFGLALVLLAGSFPATASPWLALGGACLLCAGVLVAIVHRLGRSQR